MSIKKPKSKKMVQQERRLFAHNLRQARKSAKLTQESLTKITGLSQAFISNVENAKSTINLDNAKTLADAVGQPLWKLLTPKK